MDYQYKQALELLELTDKDIEDLFINQIIEDRLEAGLGEADDHPKHKAAMMLIDQLDEQLFYLSLVNRINESVDYLYRKYVEIRDRDESTDVIDRHMFELTKFKYRIDKKLREMFDDIEELDEQYHTIIDFNKPERFFVLSNRVERINEIEELLLQELIPTTESKIVELKYGVIVLNQCKPREGTKKSKIAKLFYYMEDDFLEIANKQQYYNDLSKFIFNDKNESLLKIRNRINKIHLTKLKSSGK